MRSGGVRRRAAVAPAGWGQKRYWNCLGGKYLSSSGRFQLFMVYLTINYHFNSVVPDG